MTHHRHERRHDESEEEFLYRLEQFDASRRREHEATGKRVFEVTGGYKHSHLWTHHGRFEHTVPSDFFPNSQFEFTEPGGEIIVATYPDDASPGDIVIVKF